MPTDSTFGAALAIPAIVGALFVTVGLVLIAGAWRRAHRHANWPRVQGTVVSARQERRSHSSSDGSNDRTTYHLMVRYRFRHPSSLEETEGEDEVDRTVVVVPDGPIVVAHHPTDPGKSLLPGAGGAFGPAACGTVFALVFVVAGAAALAFALWGWGVL